MKVAIWAVVFAACAAAGALVAAHTDPFPPGVEDPGAREAAPRSSEEPVDEQRWRGQMLSETRHVFYVGGACRTSWRATFEFLATDGRFAIDSRAESRGRAACDFPDAQVRVRSIALAMSGTVREGVLRFGFTEQGRDPEGSHDLGGLVGTLRSIRPTLDIDRRTGSAMGRVLARRPDGDRGTYWSVSTFRMRCVSGC